MAFCIFATMTVSSFAPVYYAEELTTQVTEQAGVTSPAGNNADADNETVTDSGDSNQAGEATPTPEPVPSPLPDESGEDAGVETAEPTPTPTPSATPNPDETDGDSEQGEGTTDSDTSEPTGEGEENLPEATETPEEEGTEGVVEGETGEEDASESESSALDILSFIVPESDTVVAEVGETASFELELNRDDVAVAYQWQRLQMPEEAASSQVLVTPRHSYDANAPTWYNYSIADVTEAQALEQNPEMTWPGIELYYAAAEALEAIGEDTSNLSFAWRTPNYVLEGYTITAENSDGVVKIIAGNGEQQFTATLNEEGKYAFAETAEEVAEPEINDGWVDIEGATEPSLSFEVAEQDHNAYYRLKATILDDEYLKQLYTTVSEDGEETEPTQEQLDEGRDLYSVVMKVKSNESEQITFEPNDTTDGVQLMMSMLSSNANTQPYLSDDGQWICGLNGSYQYITKDTYDRAYQWYKEGKINWTQFNRYWTTLGSKGWRGTSIANVLDDNGFPTGETRTYNGFDLTDGHMLEVASEWYGKTVYFRLQGTTTLTEIQIPAYTELEGEGDKYSEAASGSKYKYAVTFLNPYVPDTGSVYQNYLNFASYNGWIRDYIPESGTITGDITNCHIRCYTIDAISFNSDPQRYMVDAEGNYRMDSVGWGVCTYQEPDLSGKAYWELKNYISNGYGFLTGHDTIYAYAGAYYDAFVRDLDESSINPNDGTTWFYDINSWNPGTTATDINGNKSASRGGHFYMNELMGTNRGNVSYVLPSPYEAASMILSTGGSHGRYGKMAMYGASKLRILKTGFSAELAEENPRYRTPTNYPNEFHEGDTILANSTHTNGQAAFGPIWVDYAENTASPQWGGYKDPLYWTIDGLTGTNNFYLTGNGNYLMNQVGHLPYNNAASDETVLFANCVMYISQRKQCEICAANQNEQHTSHFVIRISSANKDAVLNALRNGGSYWYPLNGCYQLTEDLQLPEDWTPIKNFSGHWNSDVYEVKLNSSGTPLLANDSADGASGWNLGTDQTVGVEAVFDESMNRTTGVARVVGDMNDLFDTTNKNYAGYTVKILGEDNPSFMAEDEVFSCEVNTDNKYVISNLPCIANGGAGALAARVYDTAGNEVVEYGQVIARVPEDFWNTDETTPLELLDIMVVPPEDQTIWVSEEANFTATVVTSGYAYDEAKITWQYRQYFVGSAEREWISLDAEFVNGHYVHSSSPVMKDGKLTHDYLGTTTKLAGQPFQYETIYEGYVDTGDILTSGSQSTLHIINSPLALDQFQFRIAYEDTKGNVKYSNYDPETGEKVNEGAVLTVKKPLISSNMTNSQTLFLNYIDKDGNRVYNTISGDKWPEVYGKEYDKTVDENGVPYNNGNNEAEYTSEIIWMPQLSDNIVPVVNWRYRNGHSEDEFVIFSSRYDVATGQWTTTPTENYTALLEQYPGLEIEVTMGGAPIIVDETGEPSADGEWRKISSTMVLRNARVDMDIEDTHYFFRTEAVNTYGAGDSETKISCTSSDADLNIAYSIDIVPNEGVPSYKNGYAEWTFPDLDVYAPNGVCLAAITFPVTGHNSANRVIVKANNPYGITASYTNQNRYDYVIFHTPNDKLIPEAAWQDFFRNYITLRTYDRKDANVDDVSWYITEDPGGGGFIVDGVKELVQSSGRQNGVRAQAAAGRVPGGFGQDGGAAGSPFHGMSIASYDTWTWGEGADGWWWLEVESNDGNTAGMTGRPYKSGQYLMNASNSTIAFRRSFTDVVKYEFSGRYQNVSAGGNMQVYHVLPNYGGWGTNNTSSGRRDVSVDVANLTGTQVFCMQTWGWMYTSRNGNEAVHSVKSVVEKCVFYTTDFTRSDKSAIRYSEIWANSDVKPAVTVSMTADPVKVYDGLDSRGYLHISASGNEQMIKDNAVITYYKKNGNNWVEVFSSTNVDTDVTGCFHQGTYKAVVKFNSSVINAFAFNGLDSGSKDSVSVTFQINPRPVYLHSLYMEPDDSANNPRNVKSYDGTTDAVIEHILIDNVVTGEKLTVANDVVRGTYERAEAGETLGPDGKPKQDRLEHLTEYKITRSPDTPIVLEGNTYGDYYIASENYSGGICMALLEVRVKSFRFMYGSESAPGTPTYDQSYAANTQTESWMSVEGLVPGDVLTLNANTFKLECLDTEGNPIAFTNRTPVGEYIVEPKGLTVQNYPILSNYLLYIQDGLVNIYPREIAVTASDVDWYQPDTEGVPQSHAIFEMLNDDEETYIQVGDDAKSGYGEMKLVGDDTVENTILVSGTAPTKDFETNVLTREMEDGATEETFVRTVFQNGSNIPYATTWYSGAPARYLNLQENMSLYPCEWCEEYHGFSMGTDHWSIDGYKLKINQDPEFGDTLSIAEVVNPLGETVQNYSIRYVDGLLRVHPELRFQLEATVPLEVCMYGYAGDGEVVEPENYGITNYSDGAIEITDIEVSNDGWLIVDKAPQDLLQGEMSMKMKETQLVLGHNTPAQRWIIGADHSEDDSGAEMLIPMSCYIAGGNVNERAEQYIAHVTYTIAEYGKTVPYVEGVEYPDAIDGQPVTVEPAE